MHPFKGFYGRKPVPYIVTERSVKGDLLEILDNVRESIWKL